MSLSRGPLLRIVALVDGSRVVWARGFGWADSAAKVPATAATVYRVGSVSKLFTDIAVMQLVESRLAADPRAFSVSATVTTTEPTSQGMAVVGRCVLLSPAGQVEGRRSGSPSMGSA